MDGGLREDALGRLGGKQIAIAFQRVAKFQVTIGFKFSLQGLQRVVERRKIKAQDDVAMAVFRGVPTDVRAAEERLKFIGPSAVVIVLQHGYPTGFAKATRANQKGIAFVFQRAEKAGLVNIEAALQADSPKIGPAVGNAGVG